MLTCATCGNDKTWTDVRITAEGQSATCTECGTRTETSDGMQLDTVLGDLTIDFSAWEDYR